MCGILFIGSGPRAQTEAGQQAPGELSLQQFEGFLASRGPDCTGQSQVRKDVKGVVHQAGSWQ